VLIVPVVLWTANKADIPGITCAYLTSWREAYKGLLLPDLVFAQAARRSSYDWNAGIVAPTADVVVACHDDQVVGVVQANEPPGGPRDFPEITMLYVTPNYWGTSAASGLLAAGTLWITQQGWAAARLRVVEPQARARRLYEREGWKAGPKSASSSQRLLPTPLLPAAPTCVITANRR